MKYFNILPVYLGLLAFQPVFGAVQGGDFLLCPGSSSDFRSLGQLAFPHPLIVQISDFDVSDSHGDNPVPQPNPVKSVVIKQGDSDVVLKLNDRATVSATPFRDYWNEIKKRTITLKLELDGYQDGPVQFNMEIDEYKGDDNRELGEPHPLFFLTSDHHAISARLDVSPTREACPQFGVRFGGQIRPTGFDRIAVERKYGNYVIALEGRMARYDGVAFISKVTHVDLTRATLTGVLKRKLTFTDKDAIHYVGGHHNFNWDVAIDLYQAEKLTADEKQSLEKRNLRYFFFPSVAFAEGKCTVLGFSKKFEAKPLASIEHSRDWLARECYGESHQRLPLGK